MYKKTNIYFKSSLTVIGIIIGLVLGCIIIGIIMGIICAVFNIPKPIVGVSAILILLIYAWIGSRVATKMILKERRDKNDQN